MSGKKTSHQRFGKKILRISNHPDPPQKSNGRPLFIFFFFNVSKRTVIRTTCAHPSNQYLECHCHFFWPFKQEFSTSFLSFLAKTDANCELAHATTLYIGHRFRCLTLTQATREYQTTIVHPEFPDFCS